MAGKSASLLIIDDSDVVREGLKALLAGRPELRVVGEASGGRKGLALAAKLQPDFVLLDISMPDVDGVEVARRLVREAPRSRVIMISINDDEEHVVDSFDAGARAYVVKDQAEDIFVAIEAVLAGRKFCSGGITPSSLSQAAADIDAVSKRS